MKPAQQIPFDESTLTAPQREALAITKSQGKKLHLKMHELVAHIEPEAVENLLEIVMEMRKKPAKPRTFD